MEDAKKGTGEEVEKGRGEEGLLFFFLCTSLVGNDNWNGRWAICGRAGYTCTVQDSIYLTLAQGTHVMSLSFSSAPVGGALGYMLE
jgi:hypothetical protein